MATPVYVVKRYLKGRRRNGQREYRWCLRWSEGCGFKCESTGTADRTQAEALKKVKWAEVNGLTPPRELPAPEPVKAGPGWQECRDALDRAMHSDNLRPAYINDALLMFDTLRRMLPGVASPADVTPEMANEWKRRRAQGDGEDFPAIAPWTLRGDLSTLRAVFGKWLGAECGLLSSNPFASVRPPKCDDPDVRIVSAAEQTALYAWLAERWNNWRLPQVYLDVAALLGWRATEIASVREEDLLADGFVRVAAESCKTRRHKYGWLPAEQYADLKACVAGGWAFGRFSDELRRRLIVVRKRPHHAARVMDYSPRRLVCWLQDELHRFNDEQAAAVAEAAPAWESFTLHDFRRTAITGMQMAGVSEKEASVMVGATPEVIRKHYEKLDQLAIAKRSVERRLGIGAGAKNIILARPLRAGENEPLDGTIKLPQTQVG